METSTRLPSTSLVLLLLFLPLIFAHSDANGKPAQYLPATPTPDLPAPKPTPYLPANPTPSLPAKPEQYLPAKPTPSLPAKPAQYLPAKPTPSLPAKPTPLSCDARSICRTAPFPRLCRRSTSLLSPYGSTQLHLVIRGMLGLSISAAKAASFQVSAGASAYGVGSSSAGGLSVSSQATVKALEGAMKDVNGLRRPGTAAYAQRVSSIHVQVSTAVASSDGCLKALRGVPSGFGPVTAARSVRHTMQLCSNLMVFVNKLQGTVQQDQHY